MIKISNIIQSTKEINNIYDLVFLTYVGKYVYQGTGEKPDFKDFTSVDLQRLHSNNRLTAFLDEAFDNNWINGTLDFYNERLATKVKGYDEIPEPILPIELSAITLDVQPLGIQPMYTVDMLQDIRRSVRNNQLQFVYISLIAYLLVNKYKNMVDEKITVNPDNSRHLIKLNDDILSDKYSLIYFTHVLRYPEVKNLIYIDKEYYKENYEKYLYSTWGYDMLTRGYFNPTGYTKEDKLKFLESHASYTIGMPVMLYDKQGIYNSGSLSAPSGVRLCIIRDYDKDTLTLEDTRIRNTKEGIQVQLNSSPQMRELYNAKSVQDELLEYSSHMIHLDLNDVALGGYMQGTPRGTKQNYYERSYEENYIIRPIDSNMWTRLFISRPDLTTPQGSNHTNLEVKMTYADAVLWLLGDWKVSFNQKRYLEYYKNEFEYTMPLVFMSTVDLIGALSESDEVLNNETAQIMARLYQENEYQDNSAYIDPHTDSVDTNNIELDFDMEDLDED